MTSHRFDMSCRAVQTMALGCAVLFASAACTDGGNGVKLEYDIGHPVEFSLDGAYVATSTGSQLHQMSVVGGTLEGHSSTGYYRLEILDVAYSRDCSLVAVGGFGGIHVSRGFGPHGGGGMAGDHRPRGMIWSLDFSPDNRFLASSMGVYDLENFELVRRFAPDVSDVPEKVLPLPDETAAPVEAPESIPTSAPTPAPTSAPADVDSPPFYSSEVVHYVLFHPDGKTLYVLGQERLLVFEVPSWRVVAEHALEKRLGFLANSVDMAPDGRLAYVTGTAFEAHIVTVGDAGISTRTFDLTDIPDRGTGVAFDSTGKRLALASRFAIVVLDAETGLELHRVERDSGGGLDDPGSWVRIDWHPSDAFLVASRTDNALEVIPIP